jgi:predicted small secreted protein
MTQRNQEASVKRLTHSAQSSVRLLIALALVATLALGLSACNTVAGAGKDVSNAGSTISNTAQNVQQKM